MPRPLDSRRIARAHAGAAQLFLREKAMRLVANNERLAVAAQRRLLQQGGSPFTVWVWDGVATTAATGRVPEPPHRITGCMALAVWNEDRLRARRFAPLAEEPWILQCA